MGQLVDGVWQDVWYDTKSTGGKFVHEDDRASVNEEVVASYLSV